MPPLVRAFMDLISQETRHTNAAEASAKLRERRHEREQVDAYLRALHSPIEADGRSLILFEEAVDLARGDLVGAAVLEVQAEPMSSARTAQDRVAQQVPSDGGPSTLRGRQRRRDGGSRP